MKSAGVAPLAEGMQNPPLVRRQIVGRTGGESPQQRRIARLGLRDPPFALRGRGGRIEAQHFVHQPQIPIIVQQALVGGDLGVDADPEAHVPLEFRRMSEWIGSLGGRPRAEQERRQQQGSAR